MRPHTLFLTLLVLAVLLASRFATACTLSLETAGSTSWSGGTGQGYDVFDPKTYYQPLTFRVRALDGSCAFYVTAGPTNASSAIGQINGPGGKLSFSVFRDATDAQTLRAGSFASAAEVLTGALTDKGVASYQVTYAIPAQQIVAGGAYTGDVEIAVYEGKVGAGVLRARQVVPLSVLVPAVAELSFSEGLFDPNFGIYLLNFNTMHRGDLKGVTLHTRANGGYRIYVRSLNGGAMRQLIPLDASAVAYTLSVDGKVVPITDNDMQVIAFPASTGASGNAHRVDVQIGEINGATAGDYYDLISISIYSYR